MLLNSPLVGHKYATLGKIRVALNILRDIDVHKAIKLALDIFYLRTQVVDGVSRRASTFALVILHSTLKVRRPFLGQDVRREDARKIGGELFFADVGLRTASRRFFGTAIVSVVMSVAVLQVFLLCFTSDAHTAFTTGHKATIYFWFFPDYHRMSAFNHYFLHLIEKLFIDDGCMPPFVYLAAIFEVAIVENIREDESSLLVVHPFPACSANAVIVEKLPNVFISRFVLSIELKSGADNLRLLAVQHYRLSALVI